MKRDVKKTTESSIGWASLNFQLNEFFEQFTSENHHPQRLTTQSRAFEDLS